MASLTGELVVCEVVCEAVCEVVCEVVSGLWLSTRGIVTLNWSSSSRPQGAPPLSCLPSFQEVVSGCFPSCCELFFRPVVPGSPSCLPERPPASPATLEPPIANNSNNLKNNSGQGAFHPHRETGTRMGFHDFRARIWPQDPKRFKK